MRSDRVTRLKSGVVAGLLAGGILVVVIWSFGYMTGYRMSFPLLYVVATIVGIISGAQAYAVEPETKQDDPDETLAKLQQRAEERARKRP